MSSLIIGISGVRGIYAKTLLPEHIKRFACAFGTYMKMGRIVVGRDTRMSGEIIKKHLFESLSSTGCEIIDLGICPTPSCQIMVKELKADGGIIISASHNPAEWNGLKFFKNNGIYLNEKEGKILLEIYNKRNFKEVPKKKIKPVIEDSTANEKHINRVLAHADVDLISRRKFKVVLDSCNGAGSIITPKFLKALGCEITKINCDTDSIFPHNPEPIPENLKELSGAVSETGADIGFAQDADADRLAVVSETGRIIGEEYSLCLAEKFIIQKNKGLVVTNLSTTRAFDDIANQHNCPVLRTKVGEVNVSETMKEKKAVIGGEGNGGVIDPRVHYGRDSLAGIALILQYMAQTRKSISQLAEEIPKYYVCKDKITCHPESAKKILAQFKEKYKDEKMDLTDGIKIEWANSWVHLRSSNTEPIIRIITESTNKNKSEELNKRIAAELVCCL